MGAVFGEIIDVVIKEGVTYIIKKGIDAAGKAIVGWFRDSDNDGTPDNSDPEFWVSQKEFDTMEHYEELEKACDERWEYFSEAVTDEVPSFITHQFAQFNENPLCIVISSFLLFFVGVVIFKKIISSLIFRSD